MVQLENTSQDAAGVYALFASVFASQPEGQTVEHIALLLDAAGVDASGLAASDELTQRFHDRLVVTVSPLYVPAVESCLMDARVGEGGRLEPGHIDGKRMTEVHASYKTYGFDPRTLKGFQPLVGSLRPDHLIAELAFMAHVRRLQAGEGAQARAAGEFANKFLERHLRRWLPTLCTFARQRGSEDVYVSLFEAVRDWAEVDAAAAATAAVAAAD